VAQATVEASALHLAARDWPAELLKWTFWGRNWMADQELPVCIGTPLGVCISTKRSSTSTIEFEIATFDNGL
jgi:hypothetical protein